MTHKKTGILGLIRAKRRQLTFGLISLLLGGWISALCQQCFANNNVYQYPDIEISHSSGHCVPDNTKQNNITKFDYCKVDCGCDTAIAASENYQKSQVTVVINSFNDNQLFIVKTDYYFVIKTKKTPNIFLYENPELYRLLPLERFPILLI